MNRFLGQNVSLNYGVHWTPEHAAAAHAFREFFWPPGRENQGVAINRRVAFSNRTGIGSLVKAMGHMDDQALLTTVLWLDGHSAFHRAMAVSLLARHWPEHEEDVYSPPTDEDALASVVNAPAESIVESLQRSNERPPECYIHDHFLSVLHILPP